uniref:Cyclin-like domain-containing protein n=2 Tax=Rhodosorus marinus TaxID=101924 RepID=A0A7S3AAW4_9RHOD|mmetsp:Transcript_9681/g.41568  ORF Transcript_9681/g.41568 Transcript_9681/m.41568 type:complete len:260 (+) Transcript_9681:378-1157(+)
MEEVENLNGADEKLWLFGKDDIENSPSREKNIRASTERRITASCTRFILEVGAALEVPQLTRCAAIKLMQRFYLMESMSRHSPPAVASACLFIACKVQECVKRLRDVIYWSIKIKTRSEQFPRGEDLLEESSRFQAEKKLVLQKERDVLRVLNFDYDVDLPFKYIIQLVKLYGTSAEQQKDLIQYAWNFVNDSLLTSIHMEYNETDIATAALHLAMLYSNHELKKVPETGNPWYTHYGINPKTMVEICNRMLEHYDVEV